jgi:outer membrane immunogenic protein
MGKIILSLVALATAAGLASAADLPAKAPMYQPPAPAYNWTGFYFFGGAGGGVWDANNRL